jgi:hypothetical protein
MNVIFCDIDGVLNKLDGDGSLEEDYIKALKYICDATDSSVVISSACVYDWANFKDAQKYKSLQELVRLFRRYSIRLYGFIPAEMHNSVAHKAVGINEFLLMHPEIEHYVILDDEKATLRELYDMLVLVKDGLDRSYLREVQSVLENSNNRKSFSNLDYIKFTYTHNKIVNYLASKYMGEEYLGVEDQLLLHDMDKVLMYLFYSKNHSLKLHHANVPHHAPHYIDDEADALEMMFDLEAKRYNDPCERLNAFNSLIIKHADKREIVLPYLIKYGLYSTDNKKDEDVELFKLTADAYSLNKLKEDMHDALDNLMKLYPYLYVQLREVISSDDFKKDIHDAVEDRMNEKLGLVRNIGTRDIML